MAYPELVNSSGSQQLPWPFVPKPVVRGSNTYQLLWENASPDKLVIRKSTDAGATWSTQDDGNAPTLSLFTAICQYESGTGKIYIAHVPSAGGSSVISSFDPSTDLWSAQITGGPVPVPQGSGSTPNNDAQIGLVQLSNGNFRLIIGVAFTNVYDMVKLQFATWNGSSWSAAADLMAGYVTEQFDNLNFCLVGAVLGGSDRVHVWAHTEFGYACITINSDDSLANFDRYRIDNNAPVTKNRYGTVWGKPEKVEVCSNLFLAFPLNVSNDRNSLNDGTLRRPSVILRMDAATEQAIAQHVIQERMAIPDGSWSSVSVCYDTTLRCIFLVWLREVGGVTDVDVRMSCFREVAWTTPVTVVTVPYDGGGAGLTQTMEARSDNGRMRIVFDGAGSGDGLTRYWEGDVTDEGALACAGGATSGNINAVR